MKFSRHTLEIQQVWLSGIMGVQDVTTFSDSCARMQARDTSWQSMRSTRRDKYFWTSYQLTTTALHIYGYQSDSISRVLLWYNLWKFCIIDFIFSDPSPSFWMPQHGRRWFIHALRWMFALITIERFLNDCVSQATRNEEHLHNPFGCRKCSCWSRKQSEHFRPPPLSWPVLNHQS